MRHKIITAITGFAAATMPISAQLLSIDDCIAMALEANNSIKASEFQTRQADEMVRGLKANYLPDISATATGLYSNARGSYSIEGAICPYSRSMRQVRRRLQAASPTFPA